VNAGLGKDRVRAERIAERLKQAALAIPDSLTFTPVDFERESLGHGLAATGFRADHPAFFQWLGVVPYLTRPAFSLTLDFIAGVSDSEVVFDYAEPFENHPSERRQENNDDCRQRGGKRRAVARLYQPAEISEMLRSKGFRMIEDLGLAELTKRFYGALKTGIAIGPGGHVVRARKALYD
jgi:methyltransferase (TIGR00027 family)